MIAGYRVLEALGASKRFQAFRVDMGRQADGFGILYLMHDVLGNADGFVETVNAIGAAWPFDVPDQRQYVVPQAQVWKNRPWFIVPDSLQVMSSGEGSSPAAVASLREQLRWLHEFQAPGTQPGEFAHGDVRVNRIALVGAEPFFIAPGWVAACDLALGRRLPHTRADDAYHLAKLLVQTLGPAALERPAQAATAARAPAREQAGARPAVARPAVARPAVGGEAAAREAAREAPTREATARGQAAVSARATNARAPAAAQQVTASPRGVAARPLDQNRAVAAASPRAAAQPHVAPSRAVAAQPSAASPRAAAQPQVASSQVASSQVASLQAVATQPLTPSLPAVAPPRAGVAARVAPAQPRVPPSPTAPSPTAPSPTAPSPTAPSLAAALEPAVQKGAPATDPRVVAAPPAVPPAPATLQPPAPATAAAPIAASRFADTGSERPESLPPSAMESVRPLERFEDAARLDNSPETGSLELEIVESEPPLPQASAGGATSGAASARLGAASARPDAAPPHPSRAQPEGAPHQPSRARPFLLVAAVVLCAFIGAALAYFARR